MTKQPVNKRRPVEIYFILYLAALMLLIPDLKEKKQNLVTSSVQSDLFNIFPDKSILFTRIAIDSSGYHLIASDSLNFIYYSGNVASIDFNFQIENKSLNQILNINSSNNLFDFFKYTEYPDLKEVLFHWKPPILDGRNYIYNVKVNANAVVNNFDKETGKISKMNVEASSQFTLVVSYFDRRTGLPLMASIKDNNNTQNDSTMFFNLKQSSGDIFFDFANKTVNSLTTDEWENRVSFFGINLSSELLNKPEISVSNFPENNGGTAYVKQIINNSLILAGHTPLFGKTKVKIKLTRKSDKYSAEEEFLVVPIPIQEPNYQQTIFPFQSYTFEPKLPTLSGKNYLIKIYYDSRTLFQSTNPDNFTFSVDENYIGKTLYFERYINGKLYGKSYPIQVKQYPAPQIARIQVVSSEKVKVVVNCYGLVNNRENFVKNVNILGNGTFTELVGQSTSNRQNYIFTQIFEITPKDNSKPFEFKIKIQDQRSFWSNSESYP